MRSTFTSPDRWIDGELVKICLLILLVLKAALILEAMIEMNLTEKLTR